jgi:cofilin
MKDETRGRKRICYRCGENTHRLQDCPMPRPADGALPFATCFICKKQGHLSSKCDQGGTAYPAGGCCHYCQSTQHLARNCENKSAKSSRKQARKEKKKESRKRKLNPNNLDGVDAVPMETFPEYGGAAAAAADEPVKEPHYKRAKKRVVKV